MQSNRILDFWSEILVVFQGEMTQLILICAHVSTQRFERRWSTREDLHVCGSNVKKLKNP